jgi:hypothetical protein
VISGDKNFNRMRQIGKPSVKRRNLLKISNRRRIARVNQNIAVGNGDLLIAIMRVGQANDFHKFKKMIITVIKAFAKSRFSVNNPRCSMARKKTI